MSAAHTPAPWAFERAIETDGNTTFDIFNSDVSACNGVGGGVAYIHTYSAQQAQQQEANARLICAAPALLAALEKIARMDYGNPYAMGCADVARAAIAKAVQP